MKDSPRSRAGPANSPTHRIPASTSAPQSSPSTGATYTGTNVENAAYPLGNCAEASAIAAGVQAEGARFRIAETAVWAFDREGRAIAISPCGGCRQRIREFAVDGEVKVHFPWQGGSVRTATVDELLPYAFELPGAPAK